MSLRRFTRLGLSALLLAALALPATAMNSNRWRIQCSGGARSDGGIAFRFELDHAADCEVVVPVPKGTGENHVARIVRDRE
jgi:hypothetical protein